MDGRNPTQIPIESNEFWWWADVPAEQLGCAGQKIMLTSLSELQKKDGRGVTWQVFEAEKKSRNGCSWNYNGIAEWELV